MPVNRARMEGKAYPSFGRRYDNSGTRKKHKYGYENMRPMDIPWRTQMAIGYGDALHGSWLAITGATRARAGSVSRPACSWTHKC